MAGLNFMCLSGGCVRLAGALQHCPSGWVGEGLPSAEGCWKGAGDLAPCGGNKREASGKAMRKQNGDRSHKEGSPKVNNFL